MDEFMALLLIGRICEKKRLRKCYTLEQVAKETGYTVEEIKLFETGQYNDLLLGLWYILEEKDYIKFKEIVEKESENATRHSK